MCIMSKPDPITPPPTPTPPPVLEQVAPKKAGGNESSVSKKRRGLSKYKISNGTEAKAASTPLGSIPKKTGV